MLGHHKYTRPQIRTQAGGVVKGNTGLLACLVGKVVHREPSPHKHACLTVLGIHDIVCTRVGVGVKVGQVWEKDGRTACGDQQCMERAGPIGRGRRWTSWEGPCENPPGRRQLAVPKWMASSPEDCM